MHVTRHQSLADLAARSRPLLERREAENNLLVGVMSDLARPGHAAPPRYLATVGGGGEVPLAAALCCPPFPAIVSELPDRAVPPLVDDLREALPEVVGITGPREAAEAVASRWAQVTGATTRVGMRARSYQLDEVVEPGWAAGALRRADEGDLPLVDDWSEAFTAAALPPGAPSLRGVARASLSAGRLFLWEDGSPVAMAAGVGETYNGARIALVYTPEGLRGRGYGTSCVAGTSQRLLERGKRFCFLNADLDNPASNRIYQRLGYRPVGELRELRFSG